MKLYLSGPMTGVPEFNYPAFNKAAADLRAAGYEVVSPAELDNGDTSKPREYYLRRDFQEVLKADGIALLPGWENSRGAKAEVTMGYELNLLIAPVAVFRKYTVQILNKEVSSNAR
jgi:hypothetical protein